MREDEGGRPGGRPAGEDAGEGHAGKKGKKEQ